MALQDQNKIIKIEIDSILADIRALYVSSGKKVSGQFEDGLKGTYIDSVGVNRAIIDGYQYLAGRAAGKMPAVEGILAWVRARGIQPDGMTQTSLAWAIAKKIAKDGTKKENNLKIYEEIITPKRIDDVIKKVSQFNVQQFVTELETELQTLETNI